MTKMRELMTLVEGIEAAPEKNPLAKYSDDELAKMKTSAVVAEETYRVRFSRTRSMPNGEKYRKARERVSAIKAEQRRRTWEAEKAVTEAASTAPAKLYHGTSLYSLLGILGENVLRDDFGSDDYHNGISLTTSLDVARHFAFLTSESSLDELPEQPEHAMQGAIVVLDGPKVEAVSGLVPVEWDDDDSECERRTNGPIPDVRSKIVAIYVNVEDVEWIMGVMKEHGGFEPQYLTGLHILANMTSIFPID